MNNKMMMIWTLGLIIALIPSSYGFAKGERKQKWDELNLTEAQKKQVSAIRKKHREQTKEEIMQVLTPEQKTKWQEKKSKKASNKTENSNKEEDN